MEEEEDIIYIHLPKMSEEKYAEVINSVKDFMNLRWPDFNQNRFAT